jgi:dCTP deaminase
MGILPDFEIARRCGYDGPLVGKREWVEPLVLNHPRPMISPFVPRSIKHDQLGNHIISYGLSSYGYDIRCGHEFQIFSQVNRVEVDPKDFDPEALVTVSSRERGYVLIPPNSYALTSSLEIFDIPKDVIAVAVGKSTYARCGLIVNVTPLEPEWRGVLTIEISNSTPLPARVYGECGILQLMFLQTSSSACHVSYADRGGKYQDQVGITLPKM